MRRLRKGFFRVPLQERLSEEILQSGLQAKNGVEESERPETSRTGKTETSHL